MDTENKKIKRTKYDPNAPYRNSDVWLLSVLLWPIWWAIMSYISLKNLWDNRAKFILIWTVALILWFTHIVTYEIPDTSSVSFWLFWLMYMYFQKNAVDKWSKENPETKYKNGFKSLWWGLLWIIIMFIIVFLYIMVYETYFL